jgi:hypothetical protein
LPGVLTTLGLARDHTLTPEIADQVFMRPKGDELRRLVFVRFVCEQYKSKWGWGARAEYLYEALMRGMGLGEYQEYLIWFLRPKRGRKQENELAKRIWSLKAQGKTVPQIRTIFRSEGKYFSPEKIEYYLKTHRRRG